METYLSLSKCCSLYLLVPLVIPIAGAVCGTLLGAVIAFVVWRRCVTRRRKNSTYEKIVSDHKARIQVENGHHVPMSSSVRYVFYLTYIILFDFFIQIY